MRQSFVRRVLHIFFAYASGRAQQKDTRSLSAAKRGGALANIEN